MARLTLDDLKKLRENKQREMTHREGDKPNEIIIGMGTCGIAAGAKEAFNAFLDELDKNNVSDCAVKQTGCMGLCYSEPTVEIHVDSMPEIVYGNVDSEVARKIVREHILNKRLVDDHIYDKPAKDLSAEQ